MKDILVIGSGPAGMATAVWARRLGLSVQVYEQDAIPGGQLNLIKGEIEDYPGVDCSGPELRDKIVHRLDSMGVEIVLNSHVSDLDPVQRTIVVNGHQVSGRNIVIATGGRPRKLGIPGEQEMYARGETYRSSVHASQMKGKPVIVVGGGDRAVENAYQFLKGGAHVTLVHRGDNLTARRGMTDLLRTVPGCEYLFNCTPTRIVGSQKVEGLKVEMDGKETLLKADAIVITIGLQPTTSFLHDKLPLDTEGRIETNQVYETKYRGVFAIGDAMISSQFSSIAACGGQGMVVAKQIAVSM
ncbi:NAD(P)/FAD-dependent oxidoreductase [Alicyclobacillus sp. SO9]|uniref:NAD(P)/FAD-dependent oxidoreductase n=1 Tax=Alicyclobacillus sp. SO9 TaxID=2665646 RepID=UPI0018E80CE2|nr:NAD(P)/FAD-dependent oxidoreductase [Alicyclobacillus sp. SO9]QQE77227.1 FAD-dependent oxidoreductase [Alicyclobacillus sp. SO9]